MPAPDENADAGGAAQAGEDRLSVRQAIMVWLAAAACGWLVTVAAVYLAARVL